ncbi:MAG: hypothetical protein KGJ60_06050 [Verrucomicrobiota bacterium]|nr:hypothetical protein [Verrucomicrobiota bacterium]
MIDGVHVEVILAAGYALLLAGVAAVLEWLARHSHRRAEHYRNSGFVYHRKLDVWECPTGHHLTRVETDFERKIARYRAPAHKCNACHCKKDCTDSDTGRELESRLDAWVQSELRRFHRGVSLTLLLLAVVILAAEMFRHRMARDWMVLTVLLLPIAIASSRRFAAFVEPAQKNQSDPEKSYSPEAAARGKNLI